jgi:pyruvate kinase
MRKKLEAEFDINIPLMMDLPGYSVRLGTLSSPEIHIKKG